MKDKVAPGPPVWEWTPFDLTNPESVVLASAGSYFLVFVSRIPWKVNDSFRTQTLQIY